MRRERDILDDTSAKRGILWQHATHDFPRPGRLSGAACPVVVELAAPFRDHPDHPANQEQP